MNALEHVRSLWTQAKCETEYRTVASRAYYGAYNESTALATNMQFVPTNQAADHKRLVDFLSKSGNKHCQRIGQTRLPKLHKLRKWADYQTNLPFKRSTAEEAIVIFEEISEMIDAAREEMKRNNPRKPPHANSTMQSAPAANTPLTRAKPGG